MQEVSLTQFATFEEPGRDPCGWTISAVFWGELNGSPRLQAGDDAAEARWWPWDELPTLAFDHGEILTQLQKDLHFLVESGGHRSPEPTTAK